MDVKKAPSPFITNPQSPTKPLWDIYTRIFHWLLVLGIAFQYYSAELSDSQIDHHATVGYALLGLIWFRILWGFVGPYSARFSVFVPRLRSLFNYILARPKPIYASHNPLGSLAVLAFLISVLVQAISGLFMTDDIFFNGPYQSWFNTTLTEVIQSLHNYAFTALQILIVVHIIAVLVHRFTCEPFIIKAMLDGNKPHHAYPAMSPFTLHLRAWLCMLVIMLKMWVLLVYLPEYLGLNADEYW